jgi:hypothetical protein
MLLFKSVISKEAFILQQSSSEIRIEHSKYLSSNINIHNCAFSIIFIAMTDNNSEILKIVESLQRYPLLLQQIIHFCLFCLFFKIFLIFFLLLPLSLLISTQIILILLLSTDLNRCQPLIKLIAWRAVEQDTVFGDPSSSFGEFRGLSCQSDSEDIAVGEIPTVVVDVFALCLNET